MSDSSKIPFLYTLLNLDPEVPSDKLRYNDKQVQECLMKNPTQAQERWECTLGGILHKHVSPLSMACSLGASLSVVMLIASANPSSLVERDNFGLTPLHFSVLFGNVDTKCIRFLIQKAPSTLKQEDHAGQLPLHDALWKHASVDVVTLLLDKYPQAARVALSDGRLPLHVACSNQALLEIVKLLLKQYPQACEMAEIEGGWLPLHYACRNNGSLEVIQCLLDTFPQAASRAQSHGWLPLHLACANQAELDIVSLLLSKCPESAMVQDDKGYLALHIACKYRASVDVVERLIQIYKDGCKVPAKDGSLPIHLACYRQASLDLVQLLVQAFPGGLQVLDGNGNTPLQVSRLAEERKKAFSTSLNHDSLALLSPSSQDKLKSHHPIPYDRQLCSVVCNFALLAKSAPQTAAPLSLTYLKKCTRKFSKTKNLIASTNVSDSYRALDMSTCTGFLVERFRRGVLLSIRNELVQELESLSQLNHPNLVRLLGYSLQESPKEPNYLVYEIAEAGTLASFCSSSDRSGFDWRSRIRAGASVVSAVSYLSNKNYHFESLAPENVCFWEDYTKVLLTDYGNSRLVSSQQYRDVKSPFAAPEFLEGGHEYDELCQVYSVGFILKTLITGQLPEQEEAPGISAQSLSNDADPMAGEWDARVMQKFASLTACCMASNRQERPTLPDLLEDLILLEQASAETVPSASNVLGALLQVEQVQAEKELALKNHDDDVDTHSHDGSSSTGNSSLPAIYSCCECCRKNVRGIVCGGDDRHFCCDKCFEEVVNEQLGSQTIVCREADCNAVYSAKQIHDHVEETLFYKHIKEAERASFLEDLWGRGALHVLHVRQKEALTALNAMACRDDGPPKFSPLCILCLMTSRRGGSRIPNPLATKRRFLLYFVCAFSKQPVRTAIKISRSQKWLRKVAPALKASMVALDVCVSQLKGMQMTHDMVAHHMSMPLLNDEIHQFADETWESIVDTIALYGQDASGNSARDRLQEARKVTSVAYGMLSELASSYPDWSKEMEFVSNKSGVSAWVKSENVEMWKQLE